MLAPERYDPRRRVALQSRRDVSAVADIVTQNVQLKALAPDRPVLVLDTTHAYEGYVVLRHGCVSPKELGSAKRQLEPGDVIISRLRPYLRQVAYVDEALFALAPGGNEVVASTEFFVLRGRPDFDVASLVPLLLSAPVQSALAAGQEGGHHPRFKKALLGSLPVPDWEPGEERSTAGRVRELAAGVRHSLSEGRALVGAVEARLRSDDDAD